MRIDCDPSITKEISEKFKFKVPNYKFMNAYRFGSWDGSISLYKPKIKALYIGLLEDLKSFCRENEYDLEIDPELLDTEYSEQECKEFLESLNAKFKPKPHQIKALINCIRKNRLLCVSPTASGKSFIIYLLLQHFKEQRKLIIVPTIDLVNQMKADLSEYDLDGNMESTIQQIMGGETKKISGNVVISTWQSIYKLPKTWFDQFDVIIGDEVHRFTAKSLSEMMEKTETTKYKFGLTGTLDGTLTNEMVLKGFFGPVLIVTTHKKLEDSKDVAKIKIKSIVLKYPEELRKSVRNAKYQDEINFIFANKSRNNFIKNLALSLKGNTLITFSRVDAHGIPLFESIKKKVGDTTPVYLIHGKIDKEERQEVRKIVDTHENSITVASVKIFSTGINIPHLHNIIFASPSKSRITVFQSIGRVLRITDSKTTCTLYDIVDDLSYKKWRNYSVRHYSERARMYIEEQLSFKQYDVDIKG